MFQTQRRSLVFMLAGLMLVGLVAGFASGADPSSAGLPSYDVTLTPNYLSPLDPPSSNLQAVWIYGKSPTTPYRSPDSQHQVSRYLLLDPRVTDANGNRGNDDWWFVIQRYWPSSYQPSNHGDWGLEANFHNVAGDAGPANSGGVGWGFGTGVSSLRLEWLPGANAPQFGLEPIHPNENLPLPPVTRNAWHTYVVHYIAGRTDGSTVRPGALTVWADGSDTPAINLSNVNTVQRAQGPDGNYYTQRWMQLWDGDYTRNLLSVSTVRLALTRVGNTLAQALADRPTVIGTTAPGQFYSGRGTNAGPPSVTPATPLTAADGAIPPSLGGSGSTPPAPVVTTSTTPRPTTTTTTTTATTTTSTTGTEPRPSPRPRGPRRLSGSEVEAPSGAQTVISLWWDGVHFTRWGNLKAHLQSRGVEPSAFLQGHPAIVEMLSVTPVQWDSRQFYVRTSLAAWLDRRGAKYGTWVQRHSGAALRLAA
jgi:hypothetical protein